MKIFNTIIMSAILLTGTDAYSRYSNCEELTAEKLTQILHSKDYTYKTLDGRLWQAMTSGAPILGGFEKITILKAKSAEPNDCGYGPEYPCCHYMFDTNEGGQGVEVSTRIVPY